MINLTTDNYHQEVENSRRPVMMDFWATWCDPCRRFSPVIEEVAQERNLKLCRVNVDDEPELAAAFHISAIPTALLIQNGRVIDRSDGVCPREELLQMGRK